MIATYRRHRAVANGDCRVIFSAGDYVLLKRRSPGKMATRAHGPFVFKGYTNSSRLVAELETSTGKLIQASSCNIIPFRGAPRATPVAGDVVWEAGTGEDVVVPPSAVVRYEPAQVEQDIPLSDSDWGLSDDEDEAMAAHICHLANEAGKA